MIINTIGRSTDLASVAKATASMLSTCEPTLTEISDRLTALGTTLIVELDKVSESTTVEANSTILMTYALVLGGLIITLIISIWLTMIGIVFPIKGLTTVMTGMSAGRLRLTVPGQDSKDEIGQMASATEVFRNSLEKTEDMRASAAGQKERTEVERKAAMLHLADDFERSVGSIVSMVSSAATEMQAAAAQLTTTAQETSAQSVVVSASAKEAGANVTSVASAAEQLGASVNEISRQVDNSANISAGAVKEADDTVQIVNELNEGAFSIGGVVDMITGLASQTNLLALNATIESGRARDSGKGFAVVASEVKAPPGQTSKATEEISAKVTHIQGATARAAGAIHNITETIQRINVANSVISAAVDQQSGAIQEIIQAVNQVSIGTQDVTANISGVAQAAEQTGEAAAQVLISSGELSQQAEPLRHEVDKFLANVRAA